jgi:hypothetical protein
MHLGSHKQDFRRGQLTMEFKLERVNHHEMRKSVKTYVCARKHVSQGGLPTTETKGDEHLDPFLKLDQCQERHIFKLPNGK